MGRAFGTVARATFILVAFNLISKLLGYVREAVIAYQFGTSASYDAFLVAYSVPAVLFFIINGALTTAVIPVYSQYSSRDGEAEAWKLFGMVFNVLLVILLVLSALGVLLAPWLVKLLAPYFTGETEQMTVDMIRIMFPLLVFSGLAALFGGLLNARNIFGVTALNAPLTNLGIIASVLALSAVWGVRGMALGALVGGVAYALVQVPSLLRSGFRFSRGFNLRHPGLKQILVLMLPMAVSISVSQTYVLVDRILASGLAEGSISALNYANRLIQMPLGLFVTAVGTAFFPTFTQRAADGNYAGLEDGIRRGLRVVILVCLPAAVGLMVLRDPIIALFLKRGAFDLRAAGMTQIALLFYSIGLIGQAAEFILQRGFFSLQDTVTPLKLGLVVVGVNLALSLLLIRPLQHGGLALANSIASLTSMVLLIFFLGRRLTGFWNLEMWRFGGLTVLASGVMGLVVYAVNSQSWFGALHLGNAVTALVQLGMAIGCGLVVYVVMLSLLRFEESKLVWGAVGRVLGRFGGGRRG
ncbi:MAG: murein biosynthesis integral membrane protein MurJ [Firmicutes bacterium]|nr:murein biosynthesis integral membrane protein MurJ [Bacillota bacterium]